MLTECLQKWREEKSSTVSLNFLYSIFVPDYYKK